MKSHLTSAIVAVAAAAWLGLPGTVSAAVPGPAESKRMSRAKDLIADEQWTRAIQELRAAAADPKEPSRDEALFWLAHSQNQVMDFAPAVETIRQLEREHPSSRWVKPARSLLIELAQKLQRNDVLWWTATPRAAAPVPAPAPGEAPPPAGPPRRAARVPPAPRPTARAGGATPVSPAAAPAPPAPAPPPARVWMMEDFRPDADLRIQALGSLIHTDAEKVIPMLRKIALEADNPGAARRAVFVLAQSRTPEAQSTVIEVAQTAAEPVRIAAVRELGRFGGPAVSQALLRVYSTANEPVKLQVVRSLGQRSERAALLRIAQSERVRSLRETAIVTLGHAGGRDQLRRLYSTVSMELKRPVIVGLFNARADDELIRILEREKNAKLRAEILAQLELLGTPRARSYLAKIGR
jgi:hypothetical protein